MNHKALLALIIPLILFGSVFAQEFPPYIKVLVQDPNWVFQFGEILIESPLRQQFWFWDNTTTGPIRLYGIVAEATPYGELEVYLGTTIDLEYYYDGMPFRVLYKEEMYPYSVFLLAKGDESMCYIYLIRVDHTTFGQDPLEFGPFSPCYNIFYDSYRTANDFVISVIVNHVPDNLTNYYSATAIILWQNATDFGHYIGYTFTLDPTMYPELVYYEGFRTYWLSPYVVNSTRIHIVPSFERDDFTTITTYIPIIDIYPDQGFMSLYFMEQSIPSWFPLRVNIGKLTVTSSGIEYGIPSYIGITIPPDYGGSANFFYIANMLSKEYNISLTYSEILQLRYDFIRHIKRYRVPEIRPDAIEIPLNNYGYFLYVPRDGITHLKFPAIILLPPLPIEEQLYTVDSLLLQIGYGFVPNAYPRFIPLKNGLAYLDPLELHNMGIIPKISYPSLYAYHSITIDMINNVTSYSSSYWSPIKIGIIYPTLLNATALKLGEPFNTIIKDFAAEGGFYSSIRNYREAIPAGTIERGIITTVILEYMLDSISYSVSRPFVNESDPPNLTFFGFYKVGDVLRVIQTFKLPEYLIFPWIEYITRHELYAIIDGSEQRIYGPRWISAYSDPVTFVYETPFVSATYYKIIAEARYVTEPYTVRGEYIIYATPEERYPPVINYVNITPSYYDELTGYYWVLSDETNYFNITINAQDLEEDITNYLVYINGSLYYNGTEPYATILLDGMPYGLYEIQVVVTDAILSSTNTTIYLVHTRTPILNVSITPISYTITQPMELPFNITVYYDIAYGSAILRVYADGSLIEEKEVSGSGSETYTVTIYANRSMVYSVYAELIYIPGKVITASTNATITYTTVAAGPGAPASTVTEEELVPTVPPAEITAPAIPYETFIPFIIGLSIALVLLAIYLRKR